MPDSRSVRPLATAGGAARTSVLCALAALIVFLMLAAVPQAHASVDYSTIQVKAPGGDRDHRLLYVGVDTNSTTEQVRLYPYGSATVNPRLLWRTDASKTYDVDAAGKVSKPYSTYRFTNMFSGNCLSYKLPWQDGAGVFQQASGCRGWAPNSGSGRVTLTDKAGVKNGFSLEMMDKCLEVAGGQFTAGAPLQLSACTGAWNQRFIITQRVRDHRAG